MKSHLIRKLIPITLATVIVYVLIRIIASGWADILPQIQKIKWSDALSALLITNLFWLCTAALWWMLLKQLGSTLKFKKALYIWTYSQAVRYLPGRVWNLLSRIYLCEKGGATRSQAITSTYYEMIISMGGGLLASMLIFPGHMSSLSKLSYGSITLIPILLLLITLYPPILERFTNFILSHFKKDPIKIEMTFGSVLVFLLYSLINWVLIGIAVYLITRSLVAVDLTDVPFLIGSFAAAWIVGQLSIFTHQGLGVREYTLAYFLSGLMPFPLATFIALLTRVYFTVAEIFFVISVVILGKYFDKIEKSRN